MNGLGIAGAGGFEGRQILNDTSIGIEIVNLGIAPEFRGQNAKMALEANNRLPLHHIIMLILPIDKSRKWLS